jgi:hypothetical protein
MQGYFDKLAQIESAGDPYAKNPYSSAKGRYQFIDSTAKQYGITAPFGTPEYQAQEEEAVKRFTEDNRRVLRNSLNREPTEGELYLAHQQGASGALKLLQNPDANAAQQVGGQAINLNAGNSNMSAGEFANQWVNKFDQAAPAAQANDYSNMSDEELLKLYQQGQQSTQNAPQGQADYSNMSDEELMALYQQGQPQKAGSKSPSGLVMGFGDMFAGAGQFVPRALEQVTSLGGMAPNPVSRAYKKNYETWTDPYAKNREEAYQAKRTAAGEDGVDWGRIAGNILNPVNYIGGAGLAPTLARGAAVGVLQPTSETDNYAQQKAIQGVFGAASSYAGKVVGDKISGGISKQAQQVAKLLKEKVPVTIGQRLGGAANSVEEKMMSIPLLGDMISGARARASEGINKAAYARALSPVGETIPDDIPLGRDAVKYIGNRLGEKYDDLLPKLTGKADDVFVNDLESLKNAVQVDDIINPSERAKFAKILKNTVENKFSKNGGITGESLKIIESDLGTKARALQQGTVSEQQLADALLEAQSSIRQMVRRSNPDYAEKLEAINTGYANFKRIQSAAKSGNEKGVFTPRQLSSAVRQLDKTKDKAAFARGDALMQDLSDAGSSVVSNKIPNSGTVDRGLLFGLGAAGLGSYGQTEAPGSNLATYGAAALAPGLLYTKPGVAASNVIGNKLGLLLNSQVSQYGGKALPYVTPNLLAPMLRE